MTGHEDDRPIIHLEARLRVQIRSLQQQLGAARQEIAALRTARDAALKLSVWGGARPTVETRRETP